MEKIIEIMEKINERQHVLQLDAEENYKQIIDKLNQEIEDKNKEIESRKKSFFVPRDTENGYIYMIYKDESYVNEDGKIRFKFVRKHKSMWTEEFRRIAASDACLLYRGIMPFISYTSINRIFRKKIEEEIYENDYEFDSGTSFIVTEGLEDEIFDIAVEVLRTFKN